MAVVRLRRTGLGALSSGFFLGPATIADPAPDEELVVARKLFLAGGAAIHAGAELHRDHPIVRARPDLFRPKIETQGLDLDDVTEAILD